MLYTKGLFFTAAAIALSAAVTTANAWTAEDIASNAPYTDNVLNDTDNGGNGWSSGWAVTINDFGGTPTTAEANTAVTYGGSSLMEASSGATFALVVGELDQARANRSFAAQPDGTRFQFLLQDTSATLSKALVGGLLSASDQPYVRVTNGASASTWHVADLAGATDTSIPTSSPIKVLIEKTSTSSYNITITDLTGSIATPFTQSGTPANSVEPQKLNFDVTSLEFVSGISRMLFNEPIVDLTVPVELDSFMVE